jgi:hypothetical protein
MLIFRVVWSFDKAFISAYNIPCSELNVLAFPAPLQASALLVELMLDVVFI